MEHWSATSSLEPFPVGRHKKRPDKDSDHCFRFDADYSGLNKQPPTVTVYPAGPRGVFKKNIDREERNRNSASNITGGGNKEASSSTVKVEDSKRRCLIINSNPNSPFPEQENTTDSTHGQSTQSRARREVKQILSFFQTVCNRLQEEGERRVDLAAAYEVKRKYGYLLKLGPLFGEVPGIEIGDVFKYRMELHLLSLHRPPQGGIDCMDYGGRKIAISIVDSGGYDNCMRDPETLIYCGHGGHDQRGKLAEDQKLDKGNRALYNSKEANTPVRVIKTRKVSNSLVFFYHGLYTVKDMLKVKNSGGNWMFKFELGRISGQPNFISR